MSIYVVIVKYAVLKLSLQQSVVCPLRRTVYTSESPPWLWQDAQTKRVLAAPFASWRVLAASFVVCCVCTCVRVCNTCTSVYSSVWCIVSVCAYLLYHHDSCSINMVINFSLSQFTLIVTKSQSCVSLGQFQYTCKVCVCVFARVCIYITLLVVYKLVIRKLQKMEAKQVQGVSLVMWLSHGIIQ